jgi:hypothetical protein
MCRIILAISLSKNIFKFNDDEEINLTFLFRFCLFDGVLG